MNKDEALRYIAERTAPSNDRGCRMWTGDKRGNPRYAYNSYPVAHIEARKFSAHRLQWELLRGPIPDGMLVCHHCDNPLCMNVEHHFLGTHKDNTQDMIRKGRKADARGEKAGGAKVTAAQVAEIRARRAAGEQQKDLAREFGLGEMQVSRIVRGQRWAHTYKEIN